MGQQQILLIVLSVILVGIAVAIAINVFQGASDQAELDTVANQLQNAALQAWTYWKKPASMGGADKSNATTVANKDQWLPDFTNVTGAVTVTAAAANSGNICTIAVETETTSKVGTITVSEEGSHTIAWTDAE